MPTSNTKQKRNKDCVIIMQLDSGNVYRCETCGEEFFVSWEENSCQCSGCLDQNNHECKN